ncbi:MAG: aspartate/glutamate racemase family protein [Granulosicoccus sp.]
MTDSENQSTKLPVGTIGVIMLDTRFPRFKGDIGNPDTWPFTVILKVASGARALSVVGDTSNQNLQPFIDAGIALQNMGVSAITTSCGFLSLFQSDIARHLKVPFLASSLVQLPWVQAMLPEGRQAGILTINASSLTKAHLIAAGINTTVPIQGCEKGREFTRAILHDSRDMDQSLCEQDNIEAAMEFNRRHPELGAIILECTNMAPYANAIHQATGLPVYSIYTLVNWLQSGLMPRSFAE